MATTSTIKAETLKVPGATLYYEVRGSGPTLLLMPGGPADATTFRRIEDALAAEYTVVTYDPRGLSHSTLEEALDGARMVEIFADDGHRLLDEVGGGRARIFGSSGGGVVALELARRHPEQVGTVIAHEPPSPDLLPDAEEKRAAMAAVCETCARDGMPAAMQQFMALIGIQGDPPPVTEGEPTREQLEAMAMMERNFQFFFGSYIRNLAGYRLDVAAVKASGCRIVPAVGSDSAGQLAHECGLGLARLLGTEPAVFPGDHGGFDGRPAEFAARLLEVLEG
jgi:pimeloyl-ACP methyl ester carboxylesterase